MRRRGSAKLGVLGEPARHDVASASQSRGHIFDSLAGIGVALRNTLDVSAGGLLVPKEARQRLQPFFHGLVGGSAAFWPEREIKVREFAAPSRCFDTLSQLRSQLILLADRAENGDSPVLEFQKVLQSRLYLV